MSIKEIKTGKTDFDKILGSLTREMRGLQPTVRMTTGPLLSADVAEGEFVFSTVAKDSQSPGSPATDEGRLYFKNDGILYQLTGSKVGV